MAENKHMSDLYQMQGLVVNVVEQYIDEVEHGDL